MYNSSMDPEQQVAAQRAGMQYGEITHDTGGFEPARITGWFGTINLAGRAQSTPFGPMQSRDGGGRPGMVVILDVDTPIQDQEITIIPLERVYFVRQSPKIP